MGGQGYSGCEVSKVLSVMTRSSVLAQPARRATGSACVTSASLRMARSLTQTRRASLSHSSSELAKLSRDGTLVSLVCRSVASADSPFPQTSPTAAKVFLVSPETPPSPSTSSCWKSSKLVTDISFLVRMFSVDLFANVEAEALLIDPSPLYNSDTPLMQRLGCLIFLHCVAPYRSFAQISDLRGSVMNCLRWDGKQECDMVEGVLHYRRNWQKLIVSYLWTETSSLVNKTHVNQ